MSTSHELEPGPKSCAEQRAPVFAQGLRNSMKSLAVQAKARRAGSGGFTGG